MSAIDTKVRYILEVTPGTTPADDAGWQDIPIVSESFSIAPTIGSDDSVVFDGMDREAPITDMAYNGGITANLLAGFFDEFMESAFGDNFNAGTLKMGTALKYFSLEREFPYITDEPFIVHKGLTVNTMNIGFTYPNNVSMSFEFVGMSAVSSLTSFVGIGSTAPIGDYKIIEAANGVSGVEIGGAPIAADTTLTAWNLSITRGIQSITGAGAPIGPKAPARRGKFAVTGNVEFYHSDEPGALYRNMIIGNMLDLKLTLGDGASSYTFDMPQGRMTGGGDPNVTSADSQNMLNIPFRGLRDPTSGSIIEVTRVLV